MGSLRERDVKGWNAKLSAATKRKVGGITFLCGLALLVFAYLVRHNNGSDLSLRVFKLQFIIMLIGGALYLYGAAIAGGKDKQTIFEQAWYDINKKLFSDFWGNKTRVNGGICAYEIMVGDIQITSYIKKWYETHYDEGKSYKVSQFACLCELYANSPAIVNAGCNIALTRDTRETGSLSKRAGNAVASAIGSAFGKMVTLGRAPSQPIPKSTLLDNLEFEEKFDVETDDDVRCRKYLTQRRMEMMLKQGDLTERFKLIKIDRGWLNCSSTYLSFLRNDKLNRGYVLTLLPSQLDFRNILKYREEILGCCESIQCMMSEEEGD